MAGDGRSVKRLREYIRALRPEVRSLLVADLERALLRGEEAANDELVLQELRRSIRSDAQPIPRVDSAARLFIAPLTPFLVDDTVGHGRVGRLARASMESIWIWLSRDLMPAEIKAFSEDINRALNNQDESRADQLVSALHERTIHRLRETFAAIGPDEKVRHKLAVQVGGARALEDVAGLLAILQIRNVLADLAAKLPPHIRALDGDTVETLRGHLDVATAILPPQAAAARKADVLRYGLILIMDRLGAPWQIIRVARQATETDDAGRIAASDYGAAITIAIGEMAAIISELRSELKVGRSILSLLKEFHDAARGLRAELHIPTDSEWGRQLAKIRGDIANVLRSELEATPAHIRRLLSPRPTNEGAAARPLDAIDVEATEIRIEMVVACRKYAAELALSEITSRVYADLTQYLETSMKVLLDALRHAGDADRAFRQAQAEAGIRFCRSLFGAEYAGLLTKAAEMAIHNSAAERRTIRASF